MSCGQKRQAVSLIRLYIFQLDDLGDGLDIEVDGDHVHIDKGDDHHNECRVGVNIGGGADFALTSNWIMNFELRYQLLSDFDQAVFNLGFAYRF